MKKVIYRFLFLIGIFAFIFPLASGIYKMSSESWNFFDWIIMYSFIWWPTYIAGALLIILTAKRIK